MLVREGLERLDGVESISSQPNARDSTCEIRTRGGQWLDPETLAQHIFDIRVGARLRGLEATLEGLVERRGDALVLVLPTSAGPIRLVPLARTIQLKSKPTRQERLAYQKLRKELASGAKKIRVTGPLHKAEDSVFVLELRKFQFVQETKN